MYYSASRRALNGGRGLFFCAILIILAMEAPAMAEDPVVFNDANLKAAVESTLGITDPNATDMLGLTSLAAYNKGITDLTGLEYATNLTYLSLCYNNITNISPLSGLTKLTELYLQNNYITNINSLVGLTKLKTLCIWANQITNVSPLTGWTNMNQLTLQITENPLNRAAYCHDLQTIKNNNSGITLYFDTNTNPPEAVLATDGTYTDKVAVTWEALCPGPDKSTTFTYRVSRSDTPTGTKETLSGWLTDTSFEDTTGSPGVHYYYWVESNESGGQYSNADEGWTTPYRILTVSSSTGGSVTDPNEGSHSYTSGTEITLNASADDHYHFVNWTGTAVDADKVADPNSANTTVTMDADYTITANFAIDQYQVTVTSTTGGSTDQDGTQILDYGTSLTITPTADIGNHFTEWTGDASGSDTPLTVIVISDLDITANFEPDIHILTISSGEGGSVVSPGEGSYVHDYGTVLTLKAQADDGYTFENWSTDSMNSTANPITITLTGDLSIKANFTPDSSCHLEVTSTAGGTIIQPSQASGDYAQGSEVTIEVQPVDPNTFVFLGWQGTAVEAGYVDAPNSMATTVTLYADYTAVAEFMSLLEVIYIDDDGPADPGPNDPNTSDPNENGTGQHPFDSIQEAIDVASDGATLSICNGTYDENLNLSGKSITIQGQWMTDANCPEMPVIQGTDSGPVIELSNSEDPNCAITGIIITSAPDVSTSAVNCIGASPTISNCIIAGNQPLEGEPVMLFENSSALLANCTITGNIATNSSIIACVDSPELIIINSILWSNTGSSIEALSGEMPIVIYSNVQDSMAGTGNLSQNPLFVDDGLWDANDIWINGDYHLSSETGHWDSVLLDWTADIYTSPCIDAGDPNNPIGGEPEPNGGIINMGAYGGTTQASKS